MTLKPWEILKKEDVFTAEPWIQVSVHQVRLPDGKIVDDYYQLRLLDCVLIFAQTDDGKVIMERQYKHGVRGITLLLPTGGLNDGETPLEAAQRELLEETGYAASDWQPLGRFVQMSNYGGGVSNVFLARGAKKVASPEISDLEEMEIVLMDIPALMRSIKQGEITVINTLTAILLATHPLAGQAVS